MKDQMSTEGIKEHKVHFEGKGENPIKGFESPLKVEVLSLSLVLTLTTFLSSCVAIPLSLYSSLTYKSSTTATISSPRVFPVFPPPPDAPVSVFEPRVLKNRM